MGSIATICDKLQPRVALNENGDENGFTELTLKLLCCLLSKRWGVSNVIFCLHLIAEQFLQLIASVMDFSRLS
jgi:hypothetical protein